MLASRAKLARSTTLSRLDLVEPNENIQTGMKDAENIKTSILRSERKSKNVREIGLSRRVNEKKDG
jgi:hypothetical protein